MITRNRIPSTGQWNQTTCIPLKRLIRKRKTQRTIANRTRRALLGQLAGGPARVTELAEPHGMSVNAVSKHLFVLERAGLIRRTRSGHIQACALDAAPMASAEEWIGAYRRFWSGRRME